MQGTADMERLSGIVEKDVAGRLAGCRDAGGLAGTMQDLQGSLIQKGTRVVFWVRCIEVARGFHGG